MQHTNLRSHKPRAWLTSICFAALGSVALFTAGAAQADGEALQAAIGNPHRTAANSARDGYRHPAETLQFFKVRPDMTVVEIWPAGGWYTEILAPYLKGNGKYYAAHFPADTAVDYYRRALDGFKAKLEAAPDLYGEVELVTFDPGQGVLTVPEGAADRVLTFRNVHNWLRSNGEQTAFDLFYKALKPGGILGVVEHRGKPGSDRETMLNTGYMDEDAVIALALNAGFVLDGRSEINANLRDTKDHPQGVWTLPPSLRLGDQDRERYLAIGESDRMTLRFRKPENGAVPSGD